MKTPATRELERSYAIGMTRRRARSHIFRSVIRALRNALNPSH